MISPFLANCNLQSGRNTAEATVTGPFPDLGVLQLITELGSKKPFLVDVLGAPASWEGQDLTELLASQGWNDIHITTRKKIGYRNFKWVLKGLPPEDTDPDKNTWQYLYTEGALHFFVSKTVTRGPKVQESEFQLCHQGENSI